VKECIQLIQGHMLEIEDAHIKEQIELSVDLFLIQIGDSK